MAYKNLGDVCLNQGHNVFAEAHVLLGQGGQHTDAPLAVVSQLLEQ